jgi:hypothetical protein
MAVQSYGDTDNPAQPVAFAADAATGGLKSLTVTLSGTPGTVTTITLPDSAQGFRLYPSHDTRFAVGEAPATAATSAAATIAAAAFAVGATAKANLWEERSIAAGASRTLRLKSATASAVVEVEVY